MKVLGRQATKAAAVTSSGDVPGSMAAGNGACAPGFEDRLGATRPKPQANPVLVK